MEKSGEIRIDFGEVEQLLGYPGEIYGFSGEINIDEFDKIIAQRFGNPLQYCKGAMVEIGCHAQTSTTQLSDLMKLFLDLSANKKSHLIFGTKHSQPLESKTYFCKLFITGVNTSKIPPSSIFSYLKRK